MNRFDFVALLSQYCNKEETVLVSRQTPILDASGGLQYHSDGAIKCSWPCFKPNPRSATWKAEGAWYTHTAIFKGTRATYANATVCILLVLDDIGTKSKTPPIEPSYKLETSPGNYQWGYLLNKAVKPDVFAAAVKALARAGYTDPGAINAVRKIRLPGSINLKPGRKGFAARVEHFEDMSFDLEQILDACGVTVLPSDREGAHFTPVCVADDGSDNVLAWLAEQKMVYGGPSGDGWYDVLCPNHAEHTDGSTTGRYAPVTRSYKCFHGHCQDITSPKYLEWVHAEGGPKEDVGLRDELVEAAMKGAVGKLESLRAEVEAALFPEGQDAAVVAAAVNAVAEEGVSMRDIANRIRQNWFRKYAYVLQENVFFDLDTHQVIDRIAFDALYRHLDCKSMHGKGVQNKSGQVGSGTRISASKWFDEHRDAANGHVVQGLTYAAGDDMIVERDGLKYANLWRDGRGISGGAGEVGDVSLWLKHMARMIPNEHDRKTVIEWMAYKVQNPRDKINWQIYWGSIPGGGKDTAVEPFLYAIGGPESKRRNVSVTDLAILEKEWGYHLLSEIIVINEIREVQMRGRRETENNLKPLCAAPPTTLSANRKHEHPFEIPNRLSLIAMSNYRDGLTLPANDRRWMVLWSQVERMTEDERWAMWNWYAAGGLDACAAYLGALDVSNFDAKGNAPWTTAKALLCHASLSESEEYVHDLVSRREGPFKAGVIAGPFTKLVDLLQSAAPSNMRVMRCHVDYALQHAGWVDHELCSAKIDGINSTPRRIFTAPEEYAELSKTDLRKLIHTLESSGHSGTVLRVVKGRQG